MNPTAKRGRKANPLTAVNHFNIKLDNGKVIPVTVNLEILPTARTNESKLKLIKASVKPRIKALIKQDLETQATRIEAATKLYEAMIDPAGKLKAEPIQAENFLKLMGHIFESTSTFTVTIEVTGQSTIYIFIRS
jgi:hypothetical protein